jgi:hypothetical protein
LRCGMIARIAGPNDGELVYSADIVGVEVMDQVSLHALARLICDNSTFLGFGACAKVSAGHGDINRLNPPAGTDLDLDVEIELVRSSPDLCPFFSIGFNFNNRAAKRVAVGGDLDRPTSVGGLIEKAACSYGRECHLGE